MRLLELADATRHGTGEGALLVAEKLGLEQVLGDGGAVERDEGARGAAAVAVEIARDHLLAGAALARHEDTRVGRCELCRQPQQVLHRRVGRDDLARLLGHALENGSDRLGIGRQRQELAGSGPYRRRCRSRLRVDPIDHDRQMDALGQEGPDHALRVEHHVEQQEVGPLALAKVVQRRLEAAMMADESAAAGGDPARLCHLARMVADDEKPHGRLPPQILPFSRPAHAAPFTISVIEMPRRSSRTSTSPRATSRSLT